LLFGAQENLRHKKKSIRNWGKVATAPSQQHSAEKILHRKITLPSVWAVRVSVANK